MSNIETHIGLTAKAYRGHLYDAHAHALNIHDMRALITAVQHTPPVILRIMELFEHKDTRAQMSVGDYVRAL